MRTQRRNVVMQNQANPSVVRAGNKGSTSMLYKIVAEKVGIQKNNYMHYYVVFGSRRTSQSSQRKCN